MHENVWVFKIRRIWGLTQHLVLCQLYRQGFKLGQLFSDGNAGLKTHFQTQGTYTKKLQAMLEICNRKRQYGG